MQKRTGLNVSISDNYIPDFPKIDDLTSEKNAKVYELLGKIPTSEYFGLCGG